MGERLLRQSVCLHSQSPPQKLCVDDESLDSLVLVRTGAAIAEGASQPRRQSHLTDQNAPTLSVSMLFRLYITLFARMHVTSIRIVTENPPTFHTESERALLKILQKSKLLKNGQKLFIQWPLSQNSVFTNSSGSFGILLIDSLVQNNKSKVCSPFFFFCNSRHRDLSSSRGIKLPITSLFICFTITNNPKSV